jgi:hypothetical protein
MGFYFGEMKMELREFANGMRQQEQYEFLGKRLYQLEELLDRKAIEYAEANDRDKKDEIYEEIKEIECLCETTEDYFSDFVFNEVAFGFPVSNAVLDLYQSSVQDAFAEYEVATNE